jgi:hypothetical protein
LRPRVDPRQDNELAHFRIPDLRRERRCIGKVAVLDEQELVPIYRHGQWPVRLRLGGNVVASINAPHRDSRVSNRGLGETLQHERDDDELSPGPTPNGR